ncbi:SET domain protein [Aspergillus nomiae NRRL 13137]|uniref:SET domain protein n=1 Tax=Aspergillus nomiae NRRL (strain ATCC 15546 / NRRL 13137 / CBS 260.88 / M93) TaxID=1509407 RepID=A0A0L1IND8_ASPN3|nr:SET domain protein [Aspergillus nomiae NRRL 13137]KNG80840.1 SET domain protein [Aspergillus nomiae NRRL 13137]
MDQKCIGHELSRECQPSRSECLQSRPETQRGKEATLDENTDLCDVCREGVRLSDLTQYFHRAFSTVTSATPFISMAVAGVFSSNNPGVKKYTYEGSLVRRFISCGVGVGLVTTESIPAGSVVFAEDVAWTTEEESSRCQTPREMNAMLGAKVRAMGGEWLRKFLTLPSSLKQDLGVFAGIWDLYQLPIVMNGVKTGIVGLNLASVNHACVPNCALTIINKYPKNENGNNDMRESPMIGRAIMRALRNIQKDEEITVAYFYGKGQQKARGLFSWTEFGFFCSCKECVQPKDVIEIAMDKYWKVERILNHPDTVDLYPAIAFKSAHEVIGRLLSCEIRDARVAMIWAKCAMIAGYHSDIARAMCFLAKAYRMLAILEGRFGATTRGLSTAAEGRYMLDERDVKEKLFMTAAKSDEYIHIHRYHRLSDAMAKQKGSRYLLLPEKPTKLKAAPELLEPGVSKSAHMPKHGYGPIAPERVHRSGRGTSNLRRGKDGPSENTSKGKPQVSKGHSQASTQESSSGEVCTDPDWDMLDLVRELMADNPDLFPDYPSPTISEASKKKRKKKKKKSKKGKGSAELGGYTQSNPIVKELEAEKKVVMVKEAGVRCAEEVPDSN